MPEERMMNTNCNCTLGLVITAPFSIQTLTTTGL